MITLYTFYILKFLTKKFSLLCHFAKFNSLGQNFDTPCCSFPLPIHYHCLSLSPHSQFRKLVASFPPISIDQCWLQFPIIGTKFVKLLLLWPIFIPRHLFILPATSPLLLSFFLLVKKLSPLHIDNFLCPMTFYFTHCCNLWKTKEWGYF